MVRASNRFRGSPAGGIGMTRSSGVGSAVALQALLVAALLLVPAGCNKDNVPTEKVHVPPPPPTGVKDSVQGRITFRGIGLASGSVEIYGESGKPAAGMIQMGGTYIVYNPPHGNVKIAVNSKPPEYLSKALPAKSAGNILPARYADPDTSGLTFQVTGGKQINNITLVD
jgi:hypothetical protein